MAGSVMINDSIKHKFQKLPLNDAMAIVASAHKGVNPSVFFSFASSIKMSEKKLAALLHLHPRTINNYKEDQKKLSPIESEHLLKLISLFAKGEEIFGNVDEFNYWLQKPYWNARQKPVDWLITPGGVDILLDELDRLAHGYAI